MARTKISDKSRKRKSSGIWDTIRTIAYAVIAAMVVRTVALEPFNIPSGSMIPTLLVGDYLFVSKYAYGYSKYSLPWSLDLFSGRLFGSQPERGDVAVFKLPRDNETDYIKRIVGLPGDRIQVRDGSLYVNDVWVERRPVENFSFTDVYGRTRSIVQYSETLPNGVNHNTLDANPRGNLDNTDVYTVPEGHYFAMGDNRDNSLDSRIDNSYSGVGFIPAENLVGRAEFIFYSTNGGADIWEIWKWGEATRFERLFTAVR
ncbi:MAG: signal peptidase I [Alphaproteobacteria bacterium]|jgi:signal peptidase I|nr:signal peptidase I [Alphaproteobacteria bacterium]MDP6587948.1 signal peptidase I [Alphaproteobacteria bacterium]MDP6818243.1 signal peptidase I [Alphaproteobacteria bacterium]|tara:strand:- start:10 stop:786 length:777 start_codon:yes stop_codon:yes gene_type:complete